MLIAQDFNLVICLGLHLWCQFGWDLKFFEDFDSLEFIFFLLEGLSEAFIKCETLLHSVFLFQIRKHISDAICHAMYDCAWMKCLCIGFTFMFFFLSNLPSSRPCVLCRPVGVVSFSSTLADTLVSMLGHHIVFRFSFLEYRNIHGRDLMYEPQYFPHALDFTTLAL